MEERKNRRCYLGHLYIILFLYVTEKKVDPLLSAIVDINDSPYNFENESTDVIRSLLDPVIIREGTRIVKLLSTSIITICR